MKTAVILGAGFSKNSGIPIQSEIPGLLISYEKEESFENYISRVIENFIKDTFGYTGGKNLPNIDDILTSIDISTNSGHHLGIKYSPLTLRSIRRILSYRVFSILEKNFQLSQDTMELIKHLNNSGQDTGYIVLNWDTVLEKYLQMEYGNLKIDYCNQGIEWDSEVSNYESRMIKVIKPHGSVNWLYCDNCRALYHDLHDKFTLIEKAGFIERDFEIMDLHEIVNIDKKVIKSKNCKRCGDYLSSHIATFSYRKSFRTNSFPDIWKEGEELLSNSDKWLFIGYSLPEADYEFKHLLKIAQLKYKHIRNNAPSIEVILLHSDKTTEKYKCFFGDNLNCIYNGGIKEYLDKRGSQNLKF